MHIMICANPRLFAPAQFPRVERGTTDGPRFPTCTSVVWHIWCNTPSAHLLQPILGKFVATHPPWSLVANYTIAVANYTIAEYVLCHTTHTCGTEDTQPQIMWTGGAPMVHMDWRVCTAIAASVFALAGWGRSKAHNRTHWTQPLPQPNLCRAYRSDNGFADCASGRQIWYVRKGGPINGYV